LILVPETNGVAKFGRQILFPIPSLKLTSSRSNSQKTGLSALPITSKPLSCVKALKVILISLQLIGAPG
jgi:hypothetical protein